VIANQTAYCQQEQKLINPASFLQDIFVVITSMKERIKISLKKITKGVLQKSMCANNFLSEFRLW